MKFSTSSDSKDGNSLRCRHIQLRVLHLGIGTHLLSVSRQEMSSEKIRMQRVKSNPFQYIFNDELKLEVKN